MGVRVDSMMRSNLEAPHGVPGRDKHGMDSLDLAIGAPNPNTIR